MAEELISEIIDLTATGKQVADLIAQMELIHSKMGEINGVKIGLDGLSKTKDIKVAITEASESIGKIAKMTDLATASAKEYRKQQNDLINAGVKLAASNTIEAKALAELKKQQQERTAALKNQVREESAAKGSIEQRRAALIRLQKEYDNLAPKERESASGKRLQNVIKGISDQLKNLEGSTGRFQRNVGNYQGSAKIIVDALEKANRKFQELSKSADSTPAALQRAGEELNHLRRITESPQFLNVSAKFGDATAETKFFTKALIDMERNGLGQSEAANQLRKQLAQLTGEIGGVRREIKAMSSDTRAFDLFAGSVNFLADSFQTVAGAAALFGASEEDVQEATKNLVAIQSLSNGIKGIANELTTKGTAANKAYAFMQGLVATATDATATATARLGAVLKLAGIGLLIGAIGYLVINFSKLKDMVRGVTQESKDLQEINKQSIDSFAKEKVAIESSLLALQSDKISKQEKKKIIQDLQDQYPAYLGNIKNEGKYSEELAKVINDRLIPALRAKSRIQAASALLEEADKESLELGIKREDRRAELAKSNSARILRIGLEVFDKENAAEKKRLEDRKKFLQNIQLLEQENLSKLGGDPTDTSAKEASEKQKKSAEEAAKKAKELAERNRKAEFESIQQGIRDRASAQQEIIENENNGIDRRLDALGKYADLEKQLVANQAEFEIQTEGTLASEKKVLREKSASDQLAIERENSKKGLELLQQDLEEEEKLREEKRQKQVDDIGEEFQRRGNLLEKAYAEELLELEEARSTGALTEKEYQNKRLKIEFGFQQESLESEIKYFEDFIALQKSFGEDVTEEEAKLAEARLKLRESGNSRPKNKTSQTTGDRDQIEEDLKWMKEQYSVVADEIKGLLSDAILGFFDRQKNKIQEQIDLLDVKNQKDIEAISASTASEEEKAAKIAIINAKAQAQKEQLEARQRQIDIQRARAEKAMAVAGIIAETGKAVIHQFTTGDTYTAAGRAALVGIIGALQAARVLATPIPKFKSGKTNENNYEGPAWVGDGGKSELHVKEDGTIVKTPAAPTLTYVGKNDLIFPDADRAIDDIVSASFKPMIHGSSAQVTMNNNKELVQEMRSLKAVIKSKPTLHLTVDEKGMQAIHKHTASEIKWMKEQINWNAGS
jgi:hypothetical protein